MGKYSKYSASLLDIFGQLGVVKQIVDQKSFPDEPLMSRFILTMTPTKKITDGLSWDGTASGFSFETKEFALFKCLMEAAERLGNVVYRNKDILYSSFEKINKVDCLDPILFGHDETIRQKALGWIKGINLITGKSTYIPAQAVFFNYRMGKQEPFLTEHISTGAAGGLEMDGTIARGIYEIVERDSFMTIYLNKIKAPQVNLQKIYNINIKKILEKAERYNLEVLVFDITNDLEIPSFLTVLLDRTGLGPSVTLGLKSSLSTEKAILGSIEESFHIRPWLRKEILTRQENKFNLAHDKVNNLLERGLYWLSPEMIPKLGFLFNQRPKNIKISKISIGPKKELTILKSLLLKKQIQVFYVDIGLKEFNKKGFKFVKVVAPQLQPLFLHEKNREIRKDRLESVASYFGHINDAVNQIPHPFL